MNAFDVVLTSIVIVALGSMGLQRWLDHGASHMPARLRSWFLGDHDGHQDAPRR